MKRYKSIAYYIVALLVLIIGACTKMDDYKNKYMKGGSIVYPGKMDSVKIFSGKNRVKITGLFTSDLNIVKYRVFWNSRRDSVEMPVKRTSGIDTVRVIIPNLPEGLMSFEIRTYDAQGHISVPVDTAANVYGALYQSSCTNRAIANTAIQSDGSASISWADINANAGIINMEIKYSDNNNKAHDTLITPGLTGLTTILPNFKVGNTISYRTLYLPNATAIDTFYVAYQTQGIDFSTRFHDLTNHDIAGRATMYTFNYDDAPSHSDASESAIHLVDSDYTTKYLLFTYHTDMYLQLRYRSPTVINAYTLTSGGDAPERDPKAWNLAGSNDGTNWTVVDTQTNQSFSGRKQTVKYNLGSPANYTYYRLNITANNNINTGLFQCTEWRLLEFY